MTLAEAIAVAKTYIPKTAEFVPNAIWGPLYDQLNKEIAANVYGTVDDSRFALLLANKAAKYAMSDELAFSDKGMPYVPPSKPVSYTFTYQPINSIFVNPNNSNMTVTLPNPSIIHPFVAEDATTNVEGNLTFGEKLTVLNESKNQEPLFKVPAKPIGYLIERQGCVDKSLWSIVRYLTGRDLKTRSWLHRRLPVYYVHRNRAEKAMARLRELNPEYVYRVSAYFKATTPARSQ
jgi:hypothetical protein